MTYRPISLPSEPRTLVDLPALPADVELEIHRVLDGVGPGTSVFMTGSIVEGFGNAHSDVDLHLVQDEGRPEQPLAIGMRKSRYVDCEYFAAAGLRRLATRMATTGWAELESLRDSDVDRYYRLAASLPLRITPQLGPLFATFSKDLARDVFAKKALLKAFELSSSAAWLAAQDDERAADFTLRHAAVWSATAELAALGEGYPSLKWIGEKAARLHGRGSEEHERIVASCLRPSGSLAARLAAQRQRFVLPSGMAELLDRRACRIAEGARPVRSAQGWLFVHETLGVVALSGAIADALASMSRGVRWSEAVDLLARQSGLDRRETIAAAWHESAKLRSTGHLTEGKGT